jgi:hypothetical protein
MTDLEQQLTEHLRRRAAAATPRYDLEAIQRGASTTGLVELGDRRGRRPVVIAAIGVAAAALLLVALAGVGDPPERDEVTTATEPDDPPLPETAAIRAMVDAINTRDTAAFLGAFGPEGHFAPRGDFAESSSLFGDDLPVADVELVRVWLAVMDAWGLQAELVSCAAQAVPAAGTQSDGVDAVVECEVATRWHTLSMELTEGWYFELRDTELLWWNSLSCCRNDLRLLDLNPPDRILPLGYDGLEAWEAWLQAEHPEDAARFLNPREGPPDDCDGCEEAMATLAPGDPDRAARLAPLIWNARDEWVIDGHRFSPIGLIPYDPALAEEIEASIRQYLEEQ